MELLRADLTRAHGSDGLPRREDDVVFFRLGEDGHVRGEHFWNAAYLCADDVETTAGGFDDDCAEGFGEGWVQVDVAADHDVADLFVANGAEHLDTVVQDVGFDHLLEVNGFGAGAGDDEARVGVVLQDAGDGCDEKVGAFVVEEARDDYDGDGVSRTKAMGGWIVAFGAEVGVLR